MSKEQISTTVESAGFDEVSSEDFILFYLVRVVPSKTSR